METEQEEQWRKDPNNYVWGLFYYNREDKRLMPPKYYKEMGWTVNFAYPKSILAMVALIGGSLLLIYFFAPRC